ncbi:response regulator transcription factor [Fusibacter paucivorans]|uniref:Stage 0 sporulation protein A homolog n=1 Tax=Fusibacter paucivorans TaxID=76009 RepID=A0ABS5PQ92_9FIRM|nr:response regulator transcription factor [Fusibacter paucivorans]MBS7527340.1 response regulator transcription factor [Fusibacter paucivorans]
MEKVKLVIADDHVLIREGIKKLLELEDSLEILGLASDGNEAIELVETLKPDVILLDINMPHLSGIEALKIIKSEYPATKVIMLTIHEDAEYLIETVNIGAEGYVLKDADVSSLVKAILKVNGGDIYIHPTLSGILIKEYKKKDQQQEEINNSSLTRREYEVIKLISKGYNNKEIATELFISEKTVKNHVSNIFKKIKVTDRTQAALYAIKNNISKL